MVKIKAIEFDESATAQLREMIGSLMDTSDVSAYNYANDVTIAVGQEPIIATKQMEKEAAARSLSSPELDRMFAELLQERHLYFCILTRNYSKLLVSHFLFQKRLLVKSLPIPKYTTSIKA
jgi:hypothetical protein